mgnify:CR=1 FL=1
MVQMQTYLKVADNTGAKELMCFRVLGGTRKRYANIGDVVVCSVKKAAPGAPLRRATSSRLSSCAASMACAATTVPTSVLMRTPPLSLWPTRTPRVPVSLDLLLASCVMPATPRS